MSIQYGRRASAVRRFMPLVPGGPRLRVIAAAALLLTACGGSDPEERIAAAREHLGEQDTRAAIIELKNVLTEVPDNADARLLLARAYVATGASASALKELRRAEDLGVPAGEIIPLQVESLFASQDFDAVLTYVAGLMPAERDEHPTLVGFYSAWSLTKLQRIEASLGVLAGIRPEAPDAYSIAAAALRAFVEQDSAAFAAAGAQLDTDYPDFVDGRLLLGELLYAGDEFAAAAERLAAYRVARPVSIAGTEVLARAYLELGNVEAARPLVDRLLEVAPGSARVNALAAMHAFQTAQYSDALLYAERAIQEGDRSAEIRVIAGMSAFRERRFEQAYAQLHSIRDYLAPRHPVARAYRTSRLMIGEHEAVFSELVEQGWADDSDVPYINYTSAELLKRDEPEKARELLALTDSLELSRDEMLEQGILRIALGDDASVDTLREALAADPQHEPTRLAYAFALYQAGDPDAAVEALSPLMGRGRYQARAHTLIGRIALDEGDAARAEASFERALDVEKGSLMASRYFALKALAGGDPATAESYLATAVDSHPGDAGTLALFYVTERLLGRADAARSAARRAYLDAPENEDLGLLLAVMHANADELQEALTILNALERDTDSHSHDFWRLISALAARNGNIERSIRHLEQWQKEAPEFPGSYLKLAAHYESIDQLDKALVQVLRGRERLPDNLELALAHARILVARRDHAAADAVLDEFEEAVGRGPERFTVDGLRGDILVARGELDLALPKLRSAYTAQPTPHNVARLFGLHFRRRDHDAAIRLLASHLEAHPADNGVRMTLADQTARGEPDRAVALYKEALDYSPGNRDALYKLTWLLHEQRRVDEALQYAGAAIEAWPNDAALHNLNGLVNRTKKDYTRARQSFRTAYRLDKDNIKIALNYADILVELGDFNQATKVLDAIENPLPAFARRIETLRARMG